ncbi:MAG: 3-dehydroquinate synthase [Phormidium sp. BM_Day4_Bin.17]|nr:3-dehydroquinate synthase [Phormidium sp. BM_Day4_Bin.17]UCJ10612.1 MAG: 3-dehydroquinate synthase [Phormidium sp. PBR-2020]
MTQSVIPVNLPQNAYEIALASDSLDRLGSWIKSLNLGRKLMLVSNPTVFGYYGKRAIASLESTGFEVHHHLFPDGEEHKTLDSVSGLYDAALEVGLERNSTFIALGGGVVGDMTGFAAATWLRGINFIQVPTTLLAMVDASIGGKTGVNHPQGKNLIGAFYQPRLVLIDPMVLGTLPEREFRAGIAEVIKYGVIWDADLFGQLEAAKSLASPSNLSNQLLHEILMRSCQAKAEVVSQDEKEAGLRAILNYGHTIGHAVESLTGYTELLHGEGVAIGMIAASRLAVALKLWSAEDDARQAQVIANAGLPTTIPPAVDIDAILAKLQTDKKVKDGQVRFVLPTSIGHAIVSDRVPPDLIQDTLAGLKKQSVQI